VLQGINYSSGEAVTDYFIGTLIPDFGVNCRISCYYNDAEYVKQALETQKFTKRKDCVGNDWCCAGVGCILKEEQK